MQQSQQFPSSGFAAEPLKFVMSAAWMLQNDLDETGGSPDERNDDRSVIIEDLQKAIDLLNAQWEEVE